MSWNDFDNATRFSIIGGITAMILGLVSMGALGAILYYPVSFLFGGKSIDDLGLAERFWPSVIAIGMLWSLGFLFGGIMFHFLSRFKLPTILCGVIYALELWAWAALLWYIFINYRIIK